MIEKYKALEAENERLKGINSALCTKSNSYLIQNARLEEERDELTRQHEAYVKMLGELLAVLHADGGHYQYEHGTEKAVADAITKYYELVKQLAEYKADAERLAWLLNNDTNLGVYIMCDSDDFRYVHSEEVIELADAAMKGATNDADI